jgi:hypothetical protein
MPREENSISPSVHKVFFSPYGKVGVAGKFGIRSRLQSRISEIPFNRLHTQKRVISILADFRSSSKFKPLHVKLSRLTMASAIFFLDLKGKTLLARNYRGDIPMSAVEKFMPLLSEAEEENVAPPPCISHEGVNVKS